MHATPRSSNPLAADVMLLPDASPFSKQAQIATRPSSRARLALEPGLAAMDLDEIDESLQSTVHNHLRI
jgi:hypothetical protein